MDVNDNACCLDDRVALRSIASRLAPTEAFGVVVLFYRNLPEVKNQLVFLLGLAVV